MGPAHIFRRFKAAEPFVGVGDGVQESRDLPHPAENSRDKAFGLGNARSRCGKDSVTVAVEGEIDMQAVAAFLRQRLGHKGSVQAARAAMVFTTDWKVTRLSAASSMGPYRKSISFCPGPVRGAS